MLLHGNSATFNSCSSTLAIHEFFFINNSGNRVFSLFKKTTDFSSSQHSDLNFKRSRTLYSGVYSMPVFRW